MRQVGAGLCAGFGAAVMSFTVNDFNDFKQLLSEHPDWQVELRRMIISADLEALPAIVRDLAEAQRSFERRMVQVEDRLTRVEDRLTRVEDRLSRVEDRLTRLEAAVEKLQEAVAGLQESVQGLERSIEELARIQIRHEDHFNRIEDRLGSLDGRLLELHYRFRATSYFGRWLRRVRVVDMNDVVDALESRLSDVEMDDLFNIDLIVGGRPRGKAEGEEVWLAIEVSTVVDRADVERALRRATLLRRTGHPVVPVAAGLSATEGAENDASFCKAALLKDGKGVRWDEAFAEWAP